MLLWRQIDEVLSDLPVLRASLRATQSGPDFCILPAGDLGRPNAAAVSTKEERAVLPIAYKAKVGAVSHYWQSRPVFFPCHAEVRTCPHRAIDGRRQRDVARPAVDVECV